MPFYETIFEPSAATPSIAFYEDDEEALRAVTEQHRRAVSGEPGGPGGHAAERIVDVNVYEEHPGTLGQAQTVSTDVAKKVVAEVLKEVEQDGVVGLHDLTQAILATSDSLIPKSATKPHESRFKMKEGRKLDKASWAS